MNQALIDFLACIMENMTVKLQHYLIKTRVLCNQICITRLRHFAFYFIRNYREVRRAARKFTQSSTLVVIVMTHILLTIPANTMYIYFSVPNNDTTVSNSSDSLKNFAALTYVLYVIGHAINHILFCLTNKEIQKETGKIIMNCKNIYWTQ